MRILILSCWNTWRNQLLALIKLWTRSGMIFWRGLTNCWSRKTKRKEKNARKMGCPSIGGLKNHLNLSVILHYFCRSYGKTPATESLNLVKSFILNLPFDIVIKTNLFTHMLTKMMNGMFSRGGGRVRLIFHQLFDFWLTYLTWDIYIYI